MSVLETQVEVLFGKTYLASQRPTPSCKNYHVIYLFSPQVGIVFRTLKPRHIVDVFSQAAVRACHPPLSFCRFLLAVFKTVLLRTKPSISLQHLYTNGFNLYHETPQFNTQYNGILRRHELRRCVLVYFVSWAESSQYGNTTGTTTRRTTAHRNTRLYWGK